jgi:DMSO/TMAO reductase YedYZ molybdopterin-dependent catalytic subunit
LKIAGNGVVDMADPPISRGFKSRHQTGSPRGRTPPGQHVTTDFPVLSAGPTPRLNLDDWSLSLEYAGTVLGHWTWTQFENLPQTTIRTDIHCVTKWSKLDTTWQGVTFDVLLKAAGLDQPPARYVMAHCEGGYTTNVPVDDLVDGKGAIATRFGGSLIEPVHGGPARLLVPHLYFWKSAKWLRRLSCMDANEPGFCESLGYHIRGDPWREERYDGD